LTQQAIYSIGNSVGKQLGDLSSMFTEAEVDILLLGMKDSMVKATPKVRVYKSF
jgi:hypothetical protein